LKISIFVDIAILNAYFFVYDIGLLERLENGGTVLIAEGYLWELERRGYVQSGSHVPEVVLEHPEVVKLLTEEFVHAGSEVCQAFTVSCSFIL